MIYEVYVSVVTSIFERQTFFEKKPILEIVIGENETRAIRGSNALLGIQRIFLSCVSRKFRSLHCMG